MSARETGEQLGKGGTGPQEDWTTAPDQQDVSEVQDSFGSVMYEL